MGTGEGGGDARRLGLARVRCRAPVSTARPQHRSSITWTSCHLCTPQAASRPQSFWGRAKGRRRSAPGSRPSALPCPGSQLVVFSTARRHLDVLTPAHAEASSACTVRDGRGEDDAWRRGLARRRVRSRRRERTSVRASTVALARCRAPRLNRFVPNSKIVMRGTPQTHDAASRARRSK